MLYNMLKICVSVFFNVLNKLMGGKLPPFGTASVIVEKDQEGEKNGSGEIAPQHIG